MKGIIGSVFHAAGLAYSTGTQVYSGQYIKNRKSIIRRIKFEFSHLPNIKPIKNICGGSKIYQIYFRIIFIVSGS
jgi:hypothetical protein